MPLAPFQNNVHVKYDTNNNLQYNYTMYHCFTTLEAMPPLKILWKN